MVIFGENIIFYSSLYDNTGSENFGGISDFLETKSETHPVFNIIPRDDQKPVLAYSGGKMGIMAVPGAGKTTILRDLIRNISNGINKESIDFLLSNQVAYEFRTTLVAEFHSDEDIEEIAKLIFGAKRYFLQKYVDSENCISHGFHPVGLEKAKQYAARFASSVESVSLRGYDD